MRALKGFLRRAEGDYRIGPMHVSLYVVLLDICRDGGSSGMFAIRRDEVMARAKIAAPSTYYKLMQELSEWGYVVYLSRRYGGKESKVRVV